MLLCLCLQDQVTFLCATCRWRSAHQCDPREHQVRLICFFCQHLSKVAAYLWICRLSQCLRELSFCFVEIRLAASVIFALKSPRIANFSLALATLECHLVSCFAQYWSSTSANALLKSLVCYLDLYCPHFNANWLLLALLSSLVPLITF